VGDRLDVDRDRVSNQPAASLDASICTSTLAAVGLFSSASIVPVKLILNLLSILAGCERLGGESARLGS
jgi:hypothetical protein